MARREPARGRPLITVIEAVAAAGMVTGLTVPSAVAAQPAALIPAAATTSAGHGALPGVQADQLNGVACRSAGDCLAVGADYHTGTPLAETWNGTRWRAVSVTLPSGASGALLDGVACPAATGTYTYTLTCASSAGSQTGSATLAVQLAPPLGITSSSLPGGRVGASYLTTLAATGGIPPYTWSVVGGTLPAGLSLNASSGAISGTPSATVSSTSLTFQVADSDKPAKTKAAILPLTIAAAPSAGGGGGGGLDSLTLLALAWLGCAALARRARRGVPLTVRRTGH